MTPTTRSAEPLTTKLRPARALGQALAILATLVPVGCKSARQEECRVFVYAVNSRLQEIDRVANAGAAEGKADGKADGKVDAAEMRRLAQLYEQLAEKSGAIAIHSADLKALREQYRTMVLDASRLARTIADAIDAKQIDAAMKAHEQFTAVVSREDELVSRVNAFCQRTD